MSDTNTIPIGVDGDGHPVTIDLDAIVSTRLMVQADSRQGKSSLLRLIAEGIVGLGRQVIILDVEGEFATLREIGDVLVLGGDYGEAPLTPAAAPKIGDLLASTTTSAVLDLLSMDPEDRDRFVAGLLDAWVRMPQSLWRPASPRLLLIDEVQELAPQAGKSESRPVVDKAMRLLAKRGFGVVPATQRLSTTSKGVVNVCRSNAVGPIAPKDAKDAADVLGIETKHRQALVRQDTGVFTVRGAVFGATEPLSVGVDRPQTAPPDPGDAPVTKARRGTVGKLIKALQKQQDSAGASVAATLGEAQDQIAALRKELAEAKANATPQIDQSAIDAAADEARRLNDTVWRHWISTAREETISEVAQTIVNMLTLPGGFTPGVGVNKPGGFITNSITPADPEPNVEPAAEASSPPISTNQAATPNPDRDKLTPQQRAMLDALAWFEAVGMVQPRRDNVAILSGYSPTSSGVPKAYSAMHGEGWVDYPDRSTICLTDAGRGLAARPAKPPTRYELQKAWLSSTILSPQHRSMLQLLIDIYPASIERDALAEQTGYSPTSSGVPKAVSKLTSLGLAEYVTPGVVKATKLIFPEGLR